MEKTNIDGVGMCASCGEQIGGISRTQTFWHHMAKGCMKEIPKTNEEFDKINFGCGKDRREGYLNVDYNKFVNPDLRLNMFKFPYPFKDNSVKEVLLFHVIEHFEKESVYKLFEELYRICENGAVIKIKVPYYNYYASFTDFDHKTRYYKDTFKMVCSKFNSVKSAGEELYVLKKKWNFKETYNYLHPTVYGKIIPTQKLKWFFSQFLMNIIYEMESHLVVIKE